MWLRGLGGLLSGRLGGELGLLIIGLGRVGRGDDLGILGWEEGSSIHGVILSFMTEGWKWVGFTG